MPKPATTGSFPVACGQSLTEYGLIIGLVAVVSMGGLYALSETLSGQAAHLVSAAPANPVPLPTQKWTKSGSLSSLNPSVAALTGVPEPSGIRSMPESLSGSSPLSIAPVQTVGANGGIATVYANANQLLAVANRYQDSQPELYNWLMKLGEKGVELSEAMAKSEERFRWEALPPATASPSARDNSTVLVSTASVGITSYILDKPAITQKQGEFSDMWNRSAQQSASYQRLSARDQSLVARLVKENLDLSNYQLTLDELPSPPQSAPEQVAKKNATTVGECGRDAQCPP